ncbi:MAG: glycosyltransferase family 2 protein [Nanoarchaeota archaeon]|nr:glycosyltransferase family 2 protein [Nanoarchaeota archaeon]
MFLSIIVPAYNEEKSIKRKNPQKFYDFFKKHFKHFELVFVDDGSKDQTYNLLKEFAKGKKEVCVLTNGINRGKGYAVKHGFLKAKGDYMLFSDIDLATPSEEIFKLMPYTKKGYDVVIGSRVIKGAEIKVYQPLYRQLMGKAFNRIVQILAVPGVWDTQCGFKIFSRRAVNAIVPWQTIDRWGFDVELLFLARKNKYQIKEVPITWVNDEDSRLSTIKASYQMLSEVLKVRLNHLSGKYKRKISNENIKR